LVILIQRNKSGLELSVLLTREYFVSQMLKHIISVLKHDDFLLFCELTRRGRGRGCLINHNLLFFGEFGKKLQSSMMHPLLRSLKWNDAETVTMHVGMDP